MIAKSTEDFTSCSALGQKKFFFTKMNTKTAVLFARSEEGQLFLQATDEVILFENLDNLLCCLTSLLIFHKMSSFLVTRSTCDHLL